MRSILVVVRWLLECGSVGKLGNSRRNFGSHVTSRHVPVLSDEVDPSFSRTNSSLQRPLQLQFYRSQATMAKELHEEDCYVALTHNHLDVKAMMDRVRNPKAGAIVLFAGNGIRKSIKTTHLTSLRYDSRQLSWKRSERASIYVL